MFIGYTLVLANAYISKTPHTFFWLERNVLFLDIMFYHAEVSPQLPVAHSILSLQASTWKCSHKNISKQSGQTKTKFRENFFCLSHFLIKGIHISSETVLICTSLKVITKSQPKPVNNLLQMENQTKFWTTGSYTSTMHRQWKWNPR